MTLFFNSTGKTQRLPSSDTIRMIDLTPDDGWERFCNVFIDQKDKTKLYIRTQRLKKPIGGPFGAAIIIDLKTNKIISAEYMPWAEWKNLFAHLERGPNGICVEIETEVLQKKLGEII